MSCEPSLISQLRALPGLAFGISVSSSVISVPERGPGVADNMLMIYVCKVLLIAIALSVNLAQQSGKILDHEISHCQA